MSDPTEMKCLEVGTVNPTLVCSTSSGRSYTFQANTISACVEQARECGLGISGLGSEIREACAEQMDRCVALVRGEEPPSTFADGAVIGGMVAWLPVIIGFAAWGLSVRKAIREMQTKIDTIKDSLV